MSRSIGLLFHIEKYISITISQWLIVCLVCIQCMIAKSSSSSVKILALGRTARVAATPSAR